ncbi:hypothetical protein O3M35_009494 [Rhynocoris fuscipes]|uniref:Enkurin domain-containing protein n=1 Tax=Rhynocoris fuscipes TaxID=488301 RepID=A0AAW1D339_9HEMI
MNFKKSFQMSPEMRTILPIENKKPTKNFLVENIKNLRIMQSQMETARRSLEDKAKKLQKAPKKKSPFTIRKPDEQNKWIPLPSSDENLYNQSTLANSHKTISVQSQTQQIHNKQYTDQGVQTSPPSRETEEKQECLPHPVSPKYPSNKSVTAVDDSSAYTKARAINKMLKDNGVNYIELNARRIIESKRKTKDKPDPIGIPPNYQLGALPKYLAERKSANAQEPKKNEKSPAETDQTIMRTPQNEQDRPGYILLTDEERLEHLKIMKKCYEELLVQFNQLPIRHDSLKARQKKADLEKQLENLENSMKIFSRERLYIKL